MEALSEASQKVGASHSTATVAATDEVVLQEALAPKNPSSSMSDFDAEFERELAGLDDIVIGKQSAPRPAADTTVGTIDAIKDRSMASLETPAAVKVERNFQRDLDMLSDEAMVNAIDSLDTAVAQDTKKAIQADPLQMDNVSAALTQIASSVETRNPGASVALHEDIIEVIGEVRKEEQDAKLLSMLDGLELKVKESLAKAQTPKVVRKQRAEAKFKVGQTVAAKNRGDGCWLPASVKETDGVSYVVHWLADAKSSQVCDESELREFFVGSSVEAQCANANGAWLPAVVEFHTPMGDYRVRFLHDSSITQLCPPSTVRKGAEAAAALAPLSLPPTELIALGKRCLEVILGTLNDNKRAVVSNGIKDRKVLLVTAQVMRHLRILLEHPSAGVPVFELKLAAVNTGTDETYTKLFNNVTDIIDLLSQKFILLYKALDAPGLPEDKLNAAVTKIQRIHVWLSNVTARVKAL